MKFNFIRTTFHIQNEYKEKYTEFEIWVFTSNVLELVRWVLNGGCLCLSDPSITY